MSRALGRIYLLEGCTPLRFPSRVDLRGDEEIERGRRLEEAARSLVDPRTGRADVPITRLGDVTCM